jgi:hypothetical protein
VPDALYQNGETSVNTLALDVTDAIAADMFQ